jgi:hypothetical protein
MSPFLSLLLTQPKFGLTPEYLQVYILVARFDHVAFVVLRVWNIKPSQ